MTDKPLTEMEEKQVFKLLTNRVLLATTKEEWESAPNTFVSIAIPKKLEEFVSDIKRKDDLISAIITELVCRGITHLAIEISDPAKIDSIIDSILNAEAYPN